MFAVAAKVSAVVAPRAVPLRRASPGSKPLRSPLRAPLRTSTVASAGKDEDLMEQLLAMLGGNKPGMVSESDALPGRQEEMRVSDKHFVLGNSIKSFPDTLETCVFATGCFWGTEKMFWRVPGVFSTSVGYVGGFTQNPTYEETCSGRTGHTGGGAGGVGPRGRLLRGPPRHALDLPRPHAGHAPGQRRGTQYRSGIYCVGAAKQIATAKVGRSKSRVRGRESRGAPRSHEITSEINGPPRGNHRVLLRRGLPPAVPRQARRAPLLLGAARGGARGPRVAQGKRRQARRRTSWAKYGPKPGCTIQVSNEPVPVEEALKA